MLHNHIADSLIVVLGWKGLHVCLVDARGRTPIFVIDKGLQLSEDADRADDWSRHCSEYVIERHWSLYLCGYDLVLKSITPTDRFVL